MIRHRPAGRGHAYLIEPDQVAPFHPVAGQPYELRATAPAKTERVWAEVSTGGEAWHIAARRRGEAVPDVDDIYGVPAARALGEGHLSDAVARLGAQTGRESWVVTGPELKPGDRLRYRLVEEASRTRWFTLDACQWETAGGRLVVDGGAVVASRLIGDSVEWLVGGGRTFRLRFALSLQPGEHVVGFGERFNGLDQRGKRVDTAVFDQYKGQGARSYLPMPFAFVFGRDPFAFYLDTGRRARFDVGATREDRIDVEVDIEPGAAEPELRLVLFSGGPRAGLRSFLERSGTVRHPPPDWIYRLWMSGNEWNSQARVMQEVERSAAEGIPAGVLVIEAWSDEQTFVAFNDAAYEPHPDGSPHRLADFSFPPNGRWPDPKAMVDELHRRGIKVLLWQIPLVWSKRGQAGLDQKVMVERRLCVFRDDGRPYRNRGWWFPGAVLADFTNRETRRWWTEKRRYLLEDVGIDGFKTDGGEHAWGADLVYADGTTGGESNNRFPVHYATAYHELMSSAGKPPLTFSRAGYVGSASVPCHWAGDEDSTWEAFRASISAGLTAGVCGITFWGWDFAGFSGEVPNPELYLRATEMAVFCPIMQYHSEYNHHRMPSRDRTPWNIAERTGDPSVLDAFRRLVALRERLVPYLAEQGRRAVEQCLPLMRALCFETDDERLWQFPEQYLLGDDMLVAPVTEPGATVKSVFIPAGQWLDAWRGAAVRAPAVLQVDAPLGYPPVFIRRGAAVALRHIFGGGQGRAPIASAADGARRCLT